MVGFRCWIMRHISMNDNAKRHFPLELFFYLFFSLSLRVVLSFHCCVVGSIFILFSILCVVLVLVTKHSTNSQFSSTCCLPLLVCSSVGWREKRKKRVPIQFIESTYTKRSIAYEHTLSQCERKIGGLKMVFMHRHSGSFKLIWLFLCMCTTPTMNSTEK